MTHTLDKLLALRAAACEEQQGNTIKGRKKSLRAAVAYETALLDSADTLLRLAASLSSLNGPHWNPLMVWDAQAARDESLRELGINPPQEAAGR